jgi:hypothetical protein
MAEHARSDEKTSIYINKSKYKEVCMDEVHVPNEVLKQAEASEMHAQANYVNSGEFLRRFIRRIELKPQGEKYVESF